MATTTKPWAEPTVGILTLGTGPAGQTARDSQGTLNVSSFLSPAFPFGDTADALAYALTRAKHVHLLDGLFPAFGESVALPDDARITGEPGAILQPATSGAVGMFTGSGRALIEGFRVLVSTWVASMSLMKFSSAKDVLVDRVVFQVDTHTPGGNATLAGLSLISNATPGTVVGVTSTPMVLIEFEACLRKTVSRCTFLPAYAVTCIKAQNGASFRFASNDFDNNLNVGLGGTQVAVPRLMWRGIDLTDEEWGTIIDNRWFGLGDGVTGGFGFFTGAPYPVDACIRTNTTVAPTTDEHGHSNVALNRIEAVYTHGAMRLYGVTSYLVGQNLIGYLNDGPDTVGEGGIVIAGANGNSDVIIATGITIFGHDGHNNGKALTDGAGVYATQCDELTIRSSRFGVQTANFSIVLNSAKCVNPTITGCHFQALTTATNAIRLLAGTLSKGIGIGGNTSKGITTLISDASAAEAAGRRKLLVGLQDTATGASPIITTTGDQLTTNLKLDA